MLKIRMNLALKGSSDFQQFAPFRVGVNKLLKIEIMGFLSDTTYFHSVFNSIDNPRALASKAKFDKRISSPFSIREI